MLVHATEQNSIRSMEIQDIEHIYKIILSCNLVLEFEFLWNLCTAALLNPEMLNSFEET